MSMLAVSARRSPHPPIGAKAPAARAPAGVLSARAANSAPSSPASSARPAGSVVARSALRSRLSGMAEALEEQRDVADIEQLGFDNRLAMLIEREAEHRDHRSYLGHLRQAQLRMHADIRDVDCRAGRGIARTTLTHLAAGDWIRQALNLIVEGQTDPGS